MVTEELLEEARNKYPIGTKYIYVGDSKKNISEITGDLMWGSYNNIYGKNWNIGSNPMINDCNVYRDGEWAEIIYSPQKIHEVWI